MVERYFARRSKRALSGGAWAAVLVVVALAGVASVLVIENAGTVSQPSSTTTVSTMSSTSAASASSTSVNSPANGLELSLALNTSSISYSTGHGIAATVVETNTLATPNNVSAASDWPMANLSVGPCGTLNYPVGLAVVKGYYAAGNISSAKALQIYRPGVTACPMVLASISSFEFQPSSDNATIFGSCQPAGGGCVSEIVNVTVSASDYWNGSAFTSFICGRYTVVAGDEWGGIAILHFTVGCGG
jgi:hypothetical protein